MQTHLQPAQTIIAPSLSPLDWFPVLFYPHHMLPILHSIVVLFAPPHRIGSPFASCQLCSCVFLLSALHDPDAACLPRHPFQLFLVCLSLVCFAHISHMDSSEVQVKFSSDGEFMASLVGRSSHDRKNTVDVVTAAIKQVCVHVSHFSTGLGLRIVFIPQFLCSACFRSSWSFFACCWSVYTGHTLLYLPFHHSWAYSPT